MAVALRVLALAALLFVSFAAAGALLGPPPGVNAPAPAPSATLALVALCLLDAGVLAHWILRAEVGGFRLSAAVFWVFFGVATVLTQIESAFFVALPAGALSHIVALGALVAGPFALVAPAFLRRDRPAGSGVGLPVLTPRGWCFRSAATAGAYLLLYFGFGYWVAWQSPEVRAFYGSRALARAASSCTWLRCCATTPRSCCSSCSGARSGSGSPSP